MTEETGYDEATEALGLQEIETPEEGDGARNAPAPMAQAVAGNIDTDAIDAEVYAQVLDYAEDVIEGLAGEDYVDPETLQNEFKDAVSDLVGEANNAIARIEADRDEYNQAANELAEGLYAAAVVAEELGQGYAELGDAVDFTHNQVIRNTNPTFGGSGDNEDTVRDIQRFTEDITGENPNLGLLDGRNSSGTASRGSTGKTARTVGGSTGEDTDRASGNDPFATDSRSETDNPSGATDGDEPLNVNVENADEFTDEPVWYKPWTW